MKDNLFDIDDLVLQLNDCVNPDKWDEDKYDSFLDFLCDNREYQKEAIRTALRYLLAGRYQNLADLARENFEENEILQKKYGSKKNMIAHLQFPDHLSGTIDLATGTGKSYVMYGIAAIMLAKGAVDQVLVLCPSVTIERGLIEKFKKLASNIDLHESLPEDAVIRVPHIMSANETIVQGCICVENYHAILTGSRSSITDSLKGKGKRTLILNDEAHHVVNDKTSEVKKWKSFLLDKKFDFQYIIGVSGTCYIGNDYFPDVIYRYSLRKAIEERFVKLVRYIAEMPAHDQQEDVKWQLVLNMHEDIRKKLKSQNIRPLTIVVTKDIEQCNEAAMHFKAFLETFAKESKDMIERKVLVVHSKNNSFDDKQRFNHVDYPDSEVEWIFSVSMLNEGWDVKRVFQIVPHEKRAFESKLLISQILGRGLRIPENWKGDQPEVTVFNHDRWANDIRHLVNEVLEIEKRIPSFPIESNLNFDLLNVYYDKKEQVDSVHPMNAKKYNLFDKGFVDLPTDYEEEDVTIKIEYAKNKNTKDWQTKVKYKIYQPEEMAEIMFQRFDDLMDEEDRRYYKDQYPLEKLKEIIDRSLKNSNLSVITDRIKQKFLQSMGPLQRKEAKVVRYDFTPKDYFWISTKDRRQESVSLSEIRKDKTIFFTNDTEDTLADECKVYLKEIKEPGAGYKAVIVDKYKFKTPLNAVIADHDNERRFINELIEKENAKCIDSWIKSTPTQFFEIEYYWRKKSHQKSGRFSPDFFIKVKGLILVVEVKDDDEINTPSEESRKKYEYAVRHFETLNAYLRTHASEEKPKFEYKFNFLTPKNFNLYFQSIRENKIINYRSELDAVLSNKQDES